MPSRDVAPGGAIAGSSVPLRAGGVTAVPAGVRVGLVTPLTLLSQAVAAALRSRGMEVDVVPVRDGGRPGGSGADVLLLLEDLATPTDVRRAFALLSSASAPSLVLTVRTSERSWGALLAAGATLVMSSSSSLDEVEAAVRRLHSGRPGVDPDDRLRLLRSWEAAAREHRRLARRMASLSPRERTVLEGLCAGTGVAELAERLGVAETTVRSQVKSILRKLGVRTQLAAVAAAHRLQSPVVGGSSPLRGTGGSDGRVADH